MSICAIMACIFNYLTDLTIRAHCFLFKENYKIEWNEMEKDLVFKCAIYKLAIII